jgi:CDP-glucose 4,6-dehydratase
LSAWLLELGAEVAGFALPPAGRDPLFTRLSLENRVIQTYADLREEAPIAEAIESFKPDAVIHLAAQSLVLKGYQEPKLTLDTNFGGSVNLLEAMRSASNVRALVFITSDKCYLDQESVWGYRESDQLGGLDPYSASKAAAEIVFYAYMKSYFDEKPEFGAVSARAGNVVGGGDWAQDRIVPDCIRALHGDRPITIRHPDAVRPWQHVLEPLCGYLTLAGRLLEAPKSIEGSWNFGPTPTEMRSVLELAELVVARWGVGEVNVDRPTNSPHETKTLYLNSDKARRMLNWTSRWNFERTIDKTVDWYHEVWDGADPTQVTRRQISEYMDSKV